MPENDYMYDTLMLVINNFFTQPAFFIGTITLVGLIALKKPWYECLSGFIKTAVGFYIMNVATSGFSSTFSPLINALGQKFNMDAALADTYYMQVQFQNQADPLSLYGMSNGSGLYWTAFAYVISMVTNFVLVGLQKYTRCRTLYVTGHTLRTYCQPWLWCVLLMVPAARTTPFCLCWGILAGTWAAVGSNITFESVQKVTKNAGFAVGHQEMFGLWYLNKFASLRKGEKTETKSIGDLKMPGFLSIFKDNIISVAVIAVIFFGGIMIAIGEDLMRAADSSFGGSMIFPIYILKTCFHFSVYMYILLSGVRMFVSELMRAFEGFQKKLLKGSVPAVDVAVTYNYVHPNSPLVGFLFGTIGQLIAIAGLLIFKSPLFIIPGFVPLFFDNASLAVFADRLLGYKWAIIVPFLNGLFQICMTWLMIMGIKSVTGGYTLISWGAFTDNNIIGASIIWFHYLIKNPWIALIICEVVLLGANQLYYRKHKDNYYDYMK